MRKMTAVSIVAAGLSLAVAAGVAAAGAGSEGALSSETRQGATLLRDKAFSGMGASDWARSLTDRVGPRPAGSAGDRAAVAWALAAMQSIGLSHVRAEKVTVPVWRRGIETAAIQGPYPQPLAVTALGGSVPTPPEGLEAQILEVSSIEDLETRGEAARGKIVFFDKKMQRALDMSGYSRAVDVRSGGASAAAKAGAMGALIRSIGTDHNRTPHTGGVTYSEGVAKIPAAALSIPDAELLERILAEGRPVRVRFTLGCAAQPDAESANVVGEIPGQGKDTEVVLLGAHLDSWDLGTGAIDDAAGCGIVLGAARAILESKLRHARTIRVVLFANEEYGLSGGKAYRVAHAGELVRHVAALEADSGSGRPIGFSWLAGPSAAPVLRELAAILAPLGAGELRPGGSGGADVSPLRADGVPQFSVRQDTSRYFDWHHSANDTFDKIEPGEMDRNAAAVAAFAWTAASVAAPFDRIPEDKRTDPPRARR
ncbi:MAG: M28 family peptidase [Acidobacteriota bacterium]